MYHIWVDSQGRQEGALKVALAPVTAPPNDAFAARLPLSGWSVEAGGTVLGATREARRTRHPRRGDGPFDLVTSGPRQPAAPPSSR